MAFAEDLLENVSGSTMLGVGLGVVFLAPALVPILGRGLRPVAKGAIRGYLALADGTREMFADAGERLQDLYAEARAEYAGENGTGPPEERPPTRRRRSTRPASAKGEATPEPA